MYLYFYIGECHILELRLLARIYSLSSLRGCHAPTAMQITLLKVPEPPEIWYIIKGKKREQTLDKVKKKEKKDLWSLWYFHDPPVDQ